MRMRTWIWLLLAVAVGMVAGWILSNANKPQEEQEKPLEEATRIQDVAPKTSGVVRVSREQEKKEEPEKVQAVERAKSVSDASLRPPEGGYYTNREGKLCYFSADKSTFTNGIEQLLNMVIPSSPGGSVPPLPIISDNDAKELKRAMKNRISISKDDDEAMIERKLLITQGKLEIEEQSHLKDGMSVSEYVNALRDQYNDNATFLYEAMKLEQEVYEDASLSDEDYLKLRKQINEKLAERGLPEIEDHE